MDGIDTSAQNLHSLSLTDGSVFVLLSIFEVYRNDHSVHSFFICMSVAINSSKTSVQMICPKNSSLPNLIVFKILRLVPAFRRTFSFVSSSNHGIFVILVALFFYLCKFIHAISYSYAYQLPPIWVSNKAKVLSTYTPKVDKSLKKLAMCYFIKHL